MPLIAIDASSANKPAKTGVEWYAFRLIEAMKRRPLRPGERVALWSPSPLDGALAALPAGWESKVLAWPCSGWMSLRVSADCIFGKKPDALLVPSQGFPAAAGKAKLVGVLHDVEFLLQPGLYRPEDRARLKRAYSSLARRASRLLAVSEYAKRTACDAYGIAPERVSVTPLAPALPLASYPSPMLGEGMGEVRAREGEVSPYFLALGRVEKKKGADLAVRAFDAFKAARPTDDPYELRFLGSDGFGAEEVRALAAASPYAAKIRFEGHAIDEAAARALSGATALLALSRAEGFGIAPLEAMRSGVPVIASDIPPFREVGADAPAFVRADDAGATAKAMADIVSGGSVRTRLVQAGRGRAAAFSWDETARLTWEALRDVLY